MKPCEAFLKSNGFFFSPCLGQMYSNLNSVKSEDSYRLSRESHPLFHKSASFLFDFLISKGKGRLFFLEGFFFFSLTLTLMLQCSLIAKNTRTDFRSSWNFIRNQNIKRRDAEWGMVESDTVETTLWNFPNDIWSVSPLKLLQYL